MNKEILEWLPMDCAPKDKCVLLDVGFPWPVFGVWNEVDKKWVYASLQDCDGDTYFENENEENPFSWMSIPSAREVYVF